MAGRKHIKFQEPEHAIKYGLIVTERSMIIPYDVLTAACRFCQKSNGAKNDDEYGKTDNGDAEDGNAEVVSKEESKDRKY